MLNCNTLIINNGNSDIPGLKIGGLELKIKNDGELSTIDINGNEQIIGNNKNISKIKHLGININNTTQLILPKQESQIYFDEDFSIINNEEFSSGITENSIKLLNDGNFFISFSITLDMCSRNRTVVGAYIKKSFNGTTEIIKKSESYLYFHASNVGFGTINNSFLFDGNSNSELTLYVKVKEGNGKFRTVPLSTNFNIFKIG